MSGRSLENNSSGRNQNIHDDDDEISTQCYFQYEQERNLCQISGPKAMQLTNQRFNLIINFYVEFGVKFNWPKCIMHNF